MEIVQLYVFKSVNWERILLRRASTAQKELFGIKYYAEFNEPGDPCEQNGMDVLVGKLFPKDDKLEGYACNAVSTKQYFVDNHEQYVNGDKTEGRDLIAFKIKVILNDDQYKIFKQGNPVSFLRRNIVDILSVGLTLDRQKSLSAPFKNKYSKAYDEGCSDSKPGDDQEIIKGLLKIFELYRRGYFLSFKKQTGELIAKLKVLQNQSEPDYSDIYKDLILLQQQCTQILLRYKSKKDDATAMLEVAIEKVEPRKGLEMRPVRKTIATSTEQNNASSLTSYSSQQNSGVAPPPPKSASLQLR